MTTAKNHRQQRRPPPDLTHLLEAIKAINHRKAQQRAILIPSPTAPLTQPAAAKPAQPALR